MKYLLILLLFSCCKNPNKIHYVSSKGVSGVEITCVGCDSIKPNSVIYCELASKDSLTLNCYSDYKTQLTFFQIISTAPLVDTDFDFLMRRIKELDDSIILIKKQNKWLDSVNKSLDTVKWTPYYYKPKSK